MHDPAKRGIRPSTEVGTGKLKGIKHIFEQADSGGSVHDNEDEAENAMAKS
jgi:hypothetical protein